MKVLNLEEFTKKNLKDDTMNESKLQKSYKYPIYLRGSQIYLNKGFVNIDDGSMGGSHWCCFIIKITNHTLLTHSEVNQINFY